MGFVVSSESPFFKRTKELIAGGKGAVATVFVTYLLFILWTSFNFSSSSAIAFERSLPPLSASFNSSMVFNSITLLLCAVLYRRVERILFSPILTIGSVFLCSLGTLLCSLPDFGSGNFGLYVLAGGAFTGVGSAPMLLMLSAYLVRQRNLVPFVVAALLTANMAASLLYQLPQPVLLLFVLCLPPTIVVLLSNAMKRAKSAPAQAEVVVDHADLQQMAPLLVRLLVMVLAFYSANTLAKGMYQSTGQTADPFSLVVTSLLIGVVLVLSCVAYKKFNTVSLYRTIFLFFIVCFLSVPLLQDYVGIVYGMFTVSVVVFRSLFIICECQVCIRTGLSPVLVFGIGETLKRIPNLLAPSLVSLLSVEMPYRSGQSELAFLLVPAIALVFVYVLVFTERDMHLLTEFDRTLTAQEVLERRQLAIAQEHGLTDRETEVFMLLAQGRSAPRISESLYLSQSTVNVHVRKIYQKLGIHSRQELFDLVVPPDAQAGREQDKPRKKQRRKAAGEFAEAG